MEATMLDQIATFVRLLEGAERKQRPPIYRKIQALTGWKARKIWTETGKKHAYASILAYLAHTEPGEVAPAPPPPAPVVSKTIAKRIEPIAPKSIDPISAFAPLYDASAALARVQQSPLNQLQGELKDADMRRRVRTILRSYLEHGEALLSFVDYCDKVNAVRYPAIAERIA